MKSSFLIILSFFLATAILAPSLITLSGFDTYADLIIDFGEEENKNEEKKEVNEKDFILYIDFGYLVAWSDTTSKVSSFYLEKDYSLLRTIYLPPPKWTS